MDTPSVLSNFVEACQRAVAGESARTTIAELMHDLFSDPDLLAAQIPRFSDAEVEVSPHGWRLGGEAAIHQADDLTVMVLDTLPGVLQPPHDHNMPAFIGVFEGCEDQRFWARTSDGLATTAGRRLEAGEVMSLGPKAIHAISSPTGRPARAIHVYLGDIYDVERSVFDPESLAEHPMTDARYDEFCLVD